MLKIAKENKRLIYVCFKLSEKSVYVIAECQNHKGEKQNHADELCGHKEFVTWFPACYDFVNGE